MVQCLSLDIDNEGHDSNSSPPPSNHPTRASSLQNKGNVRSPSYPVPPATSSFTLDELSSFHEKMPSVQSVWLAVPALQVLWMLQKGGNVLPERLPSLAVCFPGFHPWWVTCKFLLCIRRSMIKGDFIGVSWTWSFLSWQWHFWI